MAVVIKFFGHATPKRFFRYYMATVKKSKDLDNKQRNFDVPCPNSLRYCSRGSPDGCI